MTTETLYVPALVREQGSSTIERELRALEGVHQVSADLPAGRIILTYQPPATPATIQARMEAMGYPVAEGLGPHRPA